MGPIEMLFRALVWVSASIAAAPAVLNILLLPGEGEKIRQPGRSYIFRDPLDIEQWLFVWTLYY